MVSSVSNASLAVAVDVGARAYSPSKNNKEFQNLVAECRTLQEKCLALQEELDSKRHASQVSHELACAQEVRQRTFEVCTALRSETGRLLGLEVALESCLKTSAEAAAARVALLWQKDYQNSPKSGPALSAKGAHKRTERIHWRSQQVQTASQNVLDTVRSLEDKIEQARAGNVKRCFQILQQARSLRRPRSAIEVDAWITTDDGRAMAAEDSTSWSKYLSDLAARDELWMVDLKSTAETLHVKAREAQSRRIAASVAAAAAEQELLRAHRRRQMARCTPVLASFLSSVRWCWFISGSVDPIQTSGPGFDQSVKLNESSNVCFPDFCSGTANFTEGWNQTLWHDFKPQFAENLHSDLHSALIFAEESSRRVKLAAANEPLDYEGLGAQEGGLVDSARWVAQRQAPGRAFLRGLALLAGAVGVLSTFVKSMGSPTAVVHKKPSA